MRLPFSPFLSISANLAAAFSDDDIAPWLIDDRNINLDLIFVQAQAFSSATNLQRTKEKLYSSFSFIFFLWRILMLRLLFLDFVSSKKIYCCSHFWWPATWVTHFTYNLRPNNRLLIFAKLCNYLDTQNRNL